jgi:hypothetical protein
MVALAGASGPTQPGQSALDEEDNAQEAIVCDLEKLRERKLKNYQW